MKVGIVIFLMVVFVGMEGCVFMMIFFLERCGLLFLIVCIDV